ncbi:MAG: hypothetical protein GY699_16350 [Desulfobacteraceae bacterium]|nr:hypothetical protein [Desulfobacteraceae bacterium]
MGIFDKIFGSSKTYAPLEPTHPIAKKLDDVRQPLKDLAGTIKDSLEIVPADSATYVFIGKPPKQFGVAWVQKGEVFNLKSLVNEKGLSNTKLKDATKELTIAYERSQNEERFLTKIDDYSFVVAASQTLAQDVDRIIQTVSN